MHASCSTTTTASSTSRARSTTRWTRSGPRVLRSPPARAGGLRPTLRGSSCDRALDRGAHLLCRETRATPRDPWRRRARGAHRESRRARRHVSWDADAGFGAARCRARCSSVRATRSTIARVSASSSLSATSSTECADAASGARTRSLTVVPVNSAIRRSRGRDGDVTPRSQRETVIDSTPSSSANSFWVRPTPRLAVRNRFPTPPLSWALKLGV